MSKSAMEDGRDRPELTIEVCDLDGLRIAVGDWLTDNWSELQDGARPDVVSLLDRIQPHVRTRLTYPRNRSPAPPLPRGAADET